MGAKAEVREKKERRTSVTSRDHLEMTGCGEEGGLVRRTSIEVKCCGEGGKMRGRQYHACNIAPRKTYEGAYEIKNRTRDAPQLGDERGNGQGRLSVAGIG